MITTKYIEIIGLPGAGKTTVAKKLVECLQENGIDSAKRSPLNISILQKIQILFGVFMLLIKTPLLFRLCFCSISSEYKHVPNVRSVVRNIKLRLLVEVVVLRQTLVKDKQTFINDEGLIGRLVALSALTSLEENQMTELLIRVLPINTIIIYIDVPINISIERTLDRKIFLPFFHDMDSAMGVRFCKTNNELYANLCRRFTKDVVRVVNIGGIEELTGELQEIVNIIKYNL